ncbi:hypothetical protein [Burkholderia latens]|nr:hypothetical protein [Burkholderia latens]
MPNLAATETRGAAGHRAHAIGVALPFPIGGDRSSHARPRVTTHIR